MTHSRSTQSDCHTGLEFIVWFVLLGKLVHCNNANEYETRTFGVFLQLDIRTKSSWNSMHIADKTSKPTEENVHACMHKPHATSVAPGYQ